MFSVFPCRLCPSMYHSLLLIDDFPKIPFPSLKKGLTDADVKEKIEDDRKQIEGLRVENETENIEEDETVVNLVEAAPRIKIHTLETPDSCTHEVAVPPNFEFTGLRDSSREPAKTYKFTLGIIATIFPTFYS